MNLSPGQVGFSRGAPGLKPQPGWGQRLSAATRRAGRALAALGVGGSPGTQHGILIHSFSEAMAVTTPVCVRSCSAVGVSRAVPLAWGYKGQQRTVKLGWLGGRSKRASQENEVCAESLLPGSGD